MLSKYLCLLLASQISSSVGQALDANGVSLAEKIEAIELRLLQPGTMDFGVNRCDFLLNDNPNKGEQTAAQWVRIAFHDAVTHNKNTGLGGLDASISFESNREENSGEFVNASIADFALHTSIYRSVSDMIALGMASSMMSCDETHPSLVNIRAGRIDATEAGPAGVPGPLDSLAFSTDAFAQAGFNTTEMIQAVACGHSIGGVHRDDHPDIVGPEFTVRGNPREVASFDSTPFIFDNKVVSEYLAGTGSNPLVKTTHTPSKSDLRIFNSDGNVTMQALAPTAAFRSTCMRIFTKIIETVPSNVVLSAPIVPRRWVLRQGLLDLDANNAVKFSGTITHRNIGNSVPAKASWFFGTNGNGNTGTQLSDNARPVEGIENLPFGIVYGPLTDYDFSQTLNANNIVSFNIATAAATTTSVFSRALNPNFFVLPSKSFRRTFNTNNFANIFTEVVIRVAVRTTIIGTNTVTATLYYPKRQVGSLAGKFVRQSAVMTEVATRGNFKIYEVVIQSDAQAQGEQHIGAALGTASTTAKVKVGDLQECSTIPMTNCQ